MRYRFPDPHVVMLDECDRIKRGTRKQQLSLSLLLPSAVQIIFQLVRHTLQSLEGLAAVYGEQSSFAREVKRACFAYGSNWQW